MKCAHCGKEFEQKNKRQIYCSKNCRWAVSGKRKREKIRNEALSHYGLVCQCCGESEKVFLAIDHINGGGTKHRKENNLQGDKMLYYLKRNNWPSGYQTLCHNCNQAKSILGTCPHQNLTKEK